MRLKHTVLLIVWLVMALWMALEVGVWVMETQVEDKRTKLVVCRATDGRPIRYVPVVGTALRIHHLRLELAHLEEIAPQQDEAIRQGKYGLMALLWGLVSVVGLLVILESLGRIVFTGMELLKPRHQASSPSGSTGAQGA